MEGIIEGLAEAFVQTILTLATEEADSVQHFASNFVHQTILDSVQELNI